MGYFNYSSIIKKIYNFYMVLSLNIRVLLISLKLNMRDGHQQKMDRKKKYNN